MRDEFTGVEFLAYVWRERRVPMIACVVAVALAAGVTYFIPKRYTATAKILIEPPAGNDPRSATAVSTVYLDSLKTYVDLVSTDTLFVGAIDKLGLHKQYEGALIEDLKHRFLTVSKPVNTTLIEVSATLSDPIEAQRLAQTIAEDAVALNVSIDRQSNEDLAREPDRVYHDAKARRERAEQAQAAFLKETSVLALDQQVTAGSGLRTQVNLDLAREKTSLASYKGQQTGALPDDAPASKSWTDSQISSSGARIRDLETQQAQLEEFLDSKVPVIEKLKRQEEAIGAELRAARVEEESATTRLREIQSSAGGAQGADYGRRSRHRAAEAQFPQSASRVSGGVYSFLDWIPRVVSRPLCAGPGYPTPPRDTLQPCLKSGPLPPIRGIV